MSMKPGPVALRTAEKAPVLLALLILAAACTGVPSASVQDTSDSSTPIGRAGAPPITSPRDLSLRSADPCRTLLTPTQLGRLGYDSPAEFRITAAGSPRCTWREEDSSRRVDVALALNNDLFVNSYQRRILPVFRPLRISGLPAVDLLSSPDALTCTTTVGVADNESLDLTSSVGADRNGNGVRDPCEKGHQVAEEIISTLPPK